MAIDVKPILRAGVAAQAGALALRQARLLNKKKIRSGDLFEAGVTGIFGAAILTEQSRLISGL